MKEWEGKRIGGKKGLEWWDSKEKIGLRLGLGFEGGGQTL